jgi:hypothetical protein
MDDILQNFFDLEKPCPEQIKNCADIREQYKGELEALRMRGGCGGCMERSLRNKYIVLTSSLRI